MYRMGGIVVKYIIEYGGKSYRTDNWCEVSRILYDEEPKKINLLFIEDENLGNLL